MKNRSLILFLLLTISSASGQYLDSLGYVIRGKKNIDLRYESRWSFVDNQVISIRGIRIGAAFEKKLRLGLGVNWLKTNINAVVQTTNEYGVTENQVLYFKLGYLLAYADVVFYKTKRWQLSVPLQVGFGYTWLQEEKKYKLSNMQSRNYLFLYEPGITLQFKVTRWIGVGGDIAYRFTVKNNKKISEQLSSPTYSLKFLIWADQLYYMLAPESKWAKKYGPAMW